MFCIGSETSDVGVGQRRTLYGRSRVVFVLALTLYRMVMPIGTPFLKEKN